MTSRVCFLCDVNQMRAIRYLQMSFICTLMGAYLQSEDLRLPDSLDSTLGTNALDAEWSLLHHFQLPFLQPKAMFLSRGNINQPRNQLMKQIWSQLLHRMVSSRMIYKAFTTLISISCNSTIRRATTKCDRGCPRSDVVSTPARLSS